MKTKTADIAVIIPIYNEERHIESLVNEVNEVLKRLPYTYLICIVDDGSHDSSWDILTSLPGKIDCNLVLRRLSRNFGKDHAIIAGISFANANMYITLDGDGQHPPALIPALLSTMEEGKFDVVNAQRVESPDSPYFRRLASLTFNSVMDRISSLRLSRSCDYKLFKAKVAMALLDCGDFNFFFRGLTQWVGFKQTSVDFKVIARNFGGSKWPFKKLARYAMNNILMFSYFPVYFLLLSGALILVISIILGIKLIYYYLGGDIPSGYTTLLAMSLLSTSILTLGTGIIGLYVTKILEQTKKRPLYLISEEIIHTAGCPNNTPGKPSD